MQRRGRNGVVSPDGPWRHHLQDLVIGDLDRLRIERKPPAAAERVRQEIVALLENAAAAVPGGFDYTTAIEVRTLGAYVTCERKVPAIELPDSFFSALEAALQPE